MYFHVPSRTLRNGLHPKCSSPNRLSAYDTGASPAVFATGCPSDVDPIRFPPLGSYWGLTPVRPQSDPSTTPLRPQPDPKSGTRLIPSTGGALTPSSSAMVGSTSTCRTCRRTLTPAGTPGPAMIS